MLTRRSPRQELRIRECRPRRSSAACKPSKVEKASPAAGSRLRRSPIINDAAAARCPDPPSAAGDLAAAVRQQHRLDRNAERRAGALQETRNRVARTASASHSRDHRVDAQHAARASASGCSRVAGREPTSAATQRCCDGGRCTTPVVRRADKPQVDCPSPRARALRRAA